MTVDTANSITHSHVIDAEILTELEATFDLFRSRIAMMSFEASGVLTDMFSPLGPVDVEVIDINAIEWDQLELEVVTAERAGILALTAA